jgi:tRNA-uridine 2-sulfurtransferase
MRVLVALSGGVDSAVATARLLEAGHEVVGVHLLLAPGGAAVADARLVAESLGIDLLVWDLRERFASEVMGPFVTEYAAGRTPNPCLVCNRTLKFGAVWELARDLGFDALATGHYARIGRADDAPTLLRAVDASKDQSYVLGVLTADVVAHVVFPLGDSTKSHVRAEAAARGLPVASKPDSLDVCFISDGDAASFLAAKLGPLPGEVKDVQGAVVGQHTGAYRFTVGQRRGLRLGRPAADGQPRFVRSIDPASRTVVVGPRESLAVVRLDAGVPSWTGSQRPGPWRGWAQIRAHGAPLPAVFTSDSNSLTVVLDEPTFGVALGQTVVAYDGDRVIGSAVILRGFPG